MNWNSKVVLGVAGVAALAGALFAQGGPGRMNGGNPNGTCPACAYAQTALQPLTSDEAATLRKMREEEKLARDVCEFLYEKWNVRIFRNISASEQRHFDAIGTLLTRYGVADPANGERGVFTDTALQTLYLELTGSGDDSLKAALEAGVKIEKLDLADLEAAIAATTRPDLKRVYVNLLKGSLNHLDAFESNLELIVQ